MHRPYVQSCLYVYLKSFYGSRAEKAQFKKRGLSFQLTKMVPLDGEYFKGG